MQLINQSIEIYTQKDFTLKGLKKFIEKCARVSYKSEDKITENSYIKFVDMLVAKEHYRPLEFGTVHLKMPFNDYKEYKQNLQNQGEWNNIWIATKLINDTALITTNYRYYLKICTYLPEIIKYFDNTNPDVYIPRYTFHMITNRGVMDEARTHISLSHLAESTRYCNYSKNKFNNELTFIKPNWLDIPTGNYYYWDEEWCDIENNKINLNTDTNSDVNDFLSLLHTAEGTYMSLLNRGWKPQQAREVLPLCIKSELISCGFKQYWEHFCDLRCAKDAHPMMQELANQIKEKLMYQ